MSASLEKQTDANEPLPRVSIIIPTYNGSQRINACLLALREQSLEHAAEIVIVDDGSTDTTLGVLKQHTWVRVLSQINAGPAAARNRGAHAAQGEIILFTDDDCVPAAGWLSAMLAPFEDPAVVGVKGAYRTLQRSLAARFVQAEYEDKYRYMSKFSSIDFIDTYSAAFLRARFEQMHGYDTAFPVACAEDIELSYRMSARGWKMVFAPKALVFHQHPDTFWKYFRKKFKFAFWRMLAVKKNPSKGAKDSHTPQLMKLQLLLLPALVASLTGDLLFRLRLGTTLMVLSAFLLSTLPFSWRAARSDLMVGLIAPFALAGRACAQFLGVALGVLNAQRSAHESSVSVS